MRGDTTHTHDKQKTGINEANQLVRGMRKRARKELTPLPQIYEEERGKIIIRHQQRLPANFHSSLVYIIKIQIYRRRHFLIPQSAKDKW